MAVATLQDRSLDNAVTALLNRAVCFNLSIGRFRARKRLPIEMVTIDADKTMLSVAKTLLDAPELTAIRRNDSDTRRYVYWLALPTPFRVSVIPLSLVEQVDAKMIEFAATREGLVDAFCAVYEQRVQETAERLRVAFDRSDYPPVEFVRSMFYLRWQWVTLTTPENLPESVKFRELEKMQATWAEGLEDMRSLLRVSMNDLVAHMVDRLGGSADGKPKVFRDSMVEKITDFLGTFDARNLTDDGELATVVGKARKLLKGVNPETLRDRQDVRDKVRTGFESIKSQIDAMMTDAPKRAISFDDEE